LFVLIISSSIISFVLFYPEKDMVKSDPELKVTNNTYSYDDIWINFSSVSAFKNFSKYYSDDDFSNELHNEIIRRLKDKAEKEGEDSDMLGSYIEMVTSRYGEDYACLPCYCEKAYFNHYKLLSGYNSHNDLHMYNETRDMVISPCWIIVMNDSQDFNHIKIYVISTNDGLIRDYHVCD